LELQMLNKFFFVKKGNKKAFNIRKGLSNV
jgi:hypothetical protein